MIAWRVLIIIVISLLLILLLLLSTHCREYQRDVEKMLVATGKLDRRKGLLEDLQRENRMINSYKVR